MIRTLASILFFVTIIATGASTANAHTGIITDIDDTIKITHVNCLPDAVIRGPYTATEFLGMSSLYNEILNANKESPIYYVSGSPSFLMNAVKWLLSRNDFPYGEVFLRDFWGNPGIVEHKISKIKEILSTNNKDQFLLIGDDTESDFSIYHDIRSQYPERILATYIHLVRNDQTLPLNTTGYFNAADLAVHETIAKRISENKTKEIFEKFIRAEINDEAILPEFAFCPPEGWLMKLTSQEKISTDLQSLAKQVETKVNEKCLWNKEQIEKRERERNTSY